MTASPARADRNPLLPPLSEWLAERRAIVFDLDGTLVDTLPDLADALNEVLADAGLEPVAEDVVRDSLHGGLEASVAAALALRHAPPIWHERISAAYRARYRDLLGRHTRPFEGVAAVLTHYRRAGARLAVCTNAHQSVAEHLLMRLDLARYFDVVVGAGALTQRKPHPAPLERVLKELDMPTLEATLIGDSVADARCAHAAGVPFVFFSGGYGGEDVARSANIGTFAAYRELLP